MESKKVNIAKVMDELTALTRQQAMIDTLIVEKRQIMAKYFDKTGQREYKNSEGQIFTQERTDTKFDINGLLKNLPKDLTNQFITRRYIIEGEDWEEFVSYMKENGIKGSDIKEFFRVEKEVDKDALSDMYDHKKITLQQIKPYMDINFKKTLVLKLFKKKKKTEDDE